jgi:GTP-binding protein EngB required for normal cell division
MRVSMDSARRNIADPTMLSTPLRELIAESIALAPTHSQTAGNIVSRLEQLATRLAEQRLQLAVLGQFKRGKSTLLNALLGATVVPMAVTPLTAIPTFIISGENFHLRTIGLAEEVEDIPALDVGALQLLLRARVTEDNNPNNRLGLARVEVTVPATLLQKGIVLIDTPGVGSTYQHNTETAQAILPECDAALFVVSLDPPITATELEYLARIRATVPRIILVVNKIDVVESEDRAAAIAFLRRVAADTAGLKDAPLFCVSARRALKAKASGDGEELKASGLEELEKYLANFIAKEKSATLEQAIGQKSAALIAELKFEIESNLAALRMPIDQLTERVSTFDKAAGQFEAERNVSSDLIAGDRKRILAELDSDAERLRVRMQALIETEIATALAAMVQESAITEMLAERMPLLFQAEFKSFEAKTRTRFTELLGVHQARAEQLIVNVRRTAADLLAIGYAAPSPNESFELKKVPYWVTKSRETLHVLPPGTFDGLLPAAIRRRRTRVRFTAQTDEIIRRNVENLRWSLRQNLEEGFRSFEGRLDEQLSLTLAATREALRRGLKRRQESIDATDTEIHALVSAVEKLVGIERALEDIGVQAGGN